MLIQETFRVAVNIINIYYLFFRYTHTQTHIKWNLGTDS